jgi:hypothetical protein
MPVSCGEEMNTRLRERIDTDKLMAQFDKLIKELKYAHYKENRHKHSREQLIKLYSKDVELFERAMRVENESIR